ncbi:MULTISPECIES: hypothetical protein [unclassified Actinoplanes]|uniref:hypothetical protein n=1 Tax=unclassified Actinoplanes TaxID=2626549 RepID=UPI0002E773A8|nr:MULTISPECIES: hypothetical protein [unclassified Actinoplanes]
MRLAEVAALGDFPYRESLDRYLDGLFDERRGSPDDRECLMRARRFLFGDDITLIKYYQSITVEIALTIGGDEPSRPLSARGILFSTLNPWSNLDGLCRHATPPQFDEDHFRNQEMRLQDDDIADIVHSPDTADSWTPLKSRARLIGERVAASLNGLSQELRWPEERGIPGFRVATADEQEEERLSSLVDNDAPADHG